MKMQMRHLLPTMCACIGDKPIATLLDPCHFYDLKINALNRAISSGVMALKSFSSCFGIARICTFAFGAMS